MSGPVRLAIDGGSPVRKTVLPFTRPTLGSEEEEAASRVLRSGWLTTGRETESFEREVAQAVQTTAVVAVNSCTAALHLALAAGLKEKGEVITTSLTFASSVAAILYAGSTPVLVDVTLDDYTIDPELVAAAITENTVAVLGIDFAGQPMRLGDLRAAIADRPILLVEDAAHSFGARIGDAPIGGLADVTCFSFYATKNITTGEGGALSTNDREIASLARELRLHGMTADAWRRYMPGESVLYDIARIGFKYNLPDIAAAIGRAQLRREPGLREARRAIALRYASELSDLQPLLVPPSERSGTVHAWHLFPVRIALDRLRASRLDIVKALIAEGISCSVHFTPVHEFTAYRNLRRGSLLANVEAVGHSELSLPLWPGMTEADVSDVIVALRKVLGHYYMPRFK